MQVILIERVEKLGKIGDVVNVRDGFGRNFLIPQKKALRANKENMVVFEARRAEIEAENAARHKEAEGQVSKVEGTLLLIVRQAGEDGRLFGSVSARDIADELSAKLGIEVHRSMVRLAAPLKEIATSTVEVALHPEVVATIRVSVGRSEAEAAAAAAKETKSQQKEPAASDAAPETEAAA
jgi:large subunit ribosomal protein L9